MIKICPNCRGTGVIKTAIKVIDCPVCYGSKKVQVVDFTFLATNIPPYYAYAKNMNTIY